MERHLRKSRNGFCVELRKIWILGVKVEKDDQLITVFILYLLTRR